jgi:toxin YhaV
MTVVSGWRVLFHPEFIEKLEHLARAHDRARAAHPKDFKAHPNVKLLEALEKLIFETIPSDPARPEYRQGNTLGPEYRHWFRAKFMGRFRLFFRYDSGSKTIVYAWVNDETTLRQSGGRRDPYEIFRRMLKAGNPPNDWDALVKSSRPDYPA